jgi:hypothetical protein
MGVSTDAILFYGHAFDTEGTKPWLFDQDEQIDEDDDADWEDRYALLKGLTAPRELYPERWPHRGHTVHRRGAARHQRLDSLSGCEAQAPSRMPCQDWLALL